jgi:SAM-dependent methyltransferase
MDPTERFTRTVDAYQAHRPDYPEELFAWLAGTGIGRAADLGAGTGIFTRMLAGRGWEVVGIEPNAAMRAAAEARGGAEYLEGTAEAIPLPDGDVDLVVGAQAFHWFDLARALPEIDRVGRGWAVAAWNVRAPRGFAADYERALLTFSTDYPSVPKPEPTLAALAELRPGGERVAFSHRQELDREGVIGRAWSSSYVVHGVADREGFDRALHAAFDVHARGGAVSLEYETVAYRWATR